MDEREREAHLLHEIDRAQQAQTLMENPMMIEVFEATRNEYLMAWENSPTRDSEARESIWHFLKQLEKVKGRFLQIIETGKMASLSLEEMRTMRKAQDGQSGFRR